MQVHLFYLFSCPIKGNRSWSSCWWTMVPVIACGAMWAGPRLTLLPNRGGWGCSAPFIPCTPPWTRPTSSATLPRGSRKSMGTRTAPGSWKGEWQWPVPPWWLMGLQRHQIKLTCYSKDQNKYECATYIFT